MIHVKWLIALVLSTALSATIASHITQKYTEENVIGDVTESMIYNDAWYAKILQEMDEGKYREAKTRLGHLQGLEQRQLNDFKKRLEAGYFASQNAEAIDRINRHAAANRPSPAK